jgi:hypothetical protein
MGKKSIFHFTSQRNEAKKSVIIDPLLSLELAKTKRNKSCFAPFRLEAKFVFKAKPAHPTLAWSEIPTPGQNCTVG